jgi:hypothetical protein
MTSTSWTIDPQTGMATGLTGLEPPTLYPLLGGWWHCASEDTVSGTLDHGQPDFRDADLDIRLTHRFRPSDPELDGAVLEAELTLTHHGDTPRTLSAGFISGQFPPGPRETCEVYLPLNAAALFEDSRFDDLGREQFLKDNRQPLLPNQPLEAHYLEPLLSTPGCRTTRALLLAPVVNLQHPDSSWRVALFTPSDEPQAFQIDAASGCRLTRRLELAPGEARTLTCWMMVHRGDAATAWKAFHQIAHHDPHSTPEWVRAVQVHYYDFLSAEHENGRRGGGYDADVPYFRDFHVGMATQHGYYPTIGDYVHPERTAWPAMQGDAEGPAAMSLDRMRERIAATRAAGARACVYMHCVLMDDASPLFSSLADAVQINARGERMQFLWTGPDTLGRNWRMSLAAPAWRKHLLQQAEWIMELLDPDGIVMDETFAGLGYDHHPERCGAVSPHAIGFFRDLRKLIRGFGPEKALFSSDCGMSSFVLWADAEAGDHAYEKLLGHPLYLQEPVRYLAALGSKPWLPCAWQFQTMWEEQLAFAKQTGAGVGVSNGWMEYTGLHGLDPEDQEKRRRDLLSLFPIA